VVGGEGGEGGDGVMVQLNKYINFGSFAIRDKMTIRHQKPNNLFGFFSWSLYVYTRQGVSKTLLSLISYCCL
jgi:hypothetical protein